MKALVLGVMHAKGTSKTGRPYDFAVVRIGVPIRTAESKDRHVYAYGVEEQVVNLDPAALSQFSGLDLPGTYDLLIGPDPRDIQRNVCEGVKV